MAISFRCDCGRTFRTADENAGRSASCPECGVQLLVPASDGGARPLHEALPPVPDEDAPATKGYGYNLESEEVVPTPRRASAPAPYDRPGHDDDHPRRSNRPRYDDANRFVKRPPPAPRTWTDGGVMAGLGMMLLGVLITVGGLAVGWLIFPGPILFVAGIVSLIKGIASGKM